MERLLQANNQRRGRSAGWNLEGDWEASFRGVLKVLYSLVTVECPKVVD